MPGTAEEWRACERNFNTDWNFPRAIGAIDGKHIMLQAPIHGGSEYYNYKGFHSIVLFALVDAKYNFLFVDIGCQGRISDGGIFKNTKLYTQIMNGTMSLPEMAPLPGRRTQVPYVLLADEAFALHNNVMKPYTGNHKKGTIERIYNYRHCRARRVVENAFGILSVVFRVLRKPMLLSPEKATIIVATTIYLHNFLRNNTSRNIYSPPGEFDSFAEGEFIRGNWRVGNMDAANALLNLQHVDDRRPPISAQRIRAEFAHYFINEGRIPYQDTHE